ncbi:hypothetical protein [Escherichia coli]|nr:hypothetical protein [Escherichia coli]
MEKFHMFDDRIYQMTNGVKAADRIIYTVMLNEHDLPPRLDTTLS